MPNSFYSSSFLVSSAYVSPVFDLCRFFILLLLTNFATGEFNYDTEPLVIRTALVTLKVFLLIASVKLRIELLLLWI
jgi:hypothetical protein